MLRNDLQGQKEILLQFTNNSTIGSLITSTIIECYSVALPVLIILMIPGVEDDDDARIKVAVLFITLALTITDVTAIM